MQTEARDGPERFLGYISRARTVFVRGVDAMRVTASPLAVLNIDVPHYDLLKQSGAVLNTRVLVYSSKLGAGLQEVLPGYIVKASYGKVWVAKNDDSLDRVYDACYLHRRGLRLHRWRRRMASKATVGKRCITRTTSSGGGEILGVSFCGIPCTTDGHRSHCGFAIEPCVSPNREV